MADKNFFKNQGPFKLKQILEVSKAVLHNTEIGNSEISFNDIAPLNAANSDEIGVFHNKKYLDELKSTKAGACFISSKYVKYASKNTILLISDNPYKAYALAAQLFYPEEGGEKTISTNAHVSNSAKLGKNCTIGANAVIESNVQIGDNTIIGPNSYIGRNVVIGQNCRINNNVTISHSIIGNNAVIHSGVVIGKPGFGFASDLAGHYHIPQLGRVIIGDNVSIGANSCIDRGSGNDTIISDHCMIDNLVQIGHNVVLGKGCVLVAMVGIAGSTKLGDFVVVGGQVGIAGHLNIGSYSQIAAGSGVIKDIEPKQIYGGYPAIPVKNWHRQSIFLKKVINKFGDN